VINSRIRFPFYIFFLNPVYVAARSLRSLRSNNQLAKFEKHLSVGSISPKYSNDQRGNSTKIHQNFTSRVTFLAILKRTEINLGWLIVEKCVKEGKRLTITVNFYERNLGSGEKIWPVGGMY